MRIIVRADVGSNSKACGNSYAKISHFGKARALSSEQIFHRTVPVRMLVAEKINILAHNAILQVNKMIYNIISKK